MPSIVHFDISAEDIKRAKKFYEDLFDWKIERVPGDMEYYFISTTDQDGKPGLGGGLGKKSGDDPIINYVGVDSVDEYVDKAVQLGAKINKPKMTVPGFGHLAIIKDTEGNLIGLWETNV